MPLFGPFLILSALELTVFVVVCLLVGFPAALGLLAAGSIAGVLVLRVQGLATFGRMRQRIEAGDTTGLVETLWRTAAGVLLVVPGFLTDILALALLVPWFRRLLGGLVVGLLVARGLSRGRRSAPQSPTPADPSAWPPVTPPPPPRTGGPVIDVEFEDLPPRAGDTRP